MRVKCVSAYRSAGTQRHRGLRPWSRSRWTISGPSCHSPRTTCWTSYGYWSRVVYHDDIYITAIALQFLENISRKKRAFIDHLVEKKFNCLDIYTFQRVVPTASAPVLCIMRSCRYLGDHAEAPLYPSCPQKSRANRVYRIKLVRHQELLSRKLCYFFYLFQETILGLTFLSENRNVV